MYNLIKDTQFTFLYHKLVTTDLVYVKYPDFRYLPYS